jgi:hypothetical protein
MDDRNSRKARDNALCARLALLHPLAWASASVGAHARDIEPRAFANTPVGIAFLFGGYAYTEGTVGTVFHFLRGHQGNGLFREALLFPSEEPKVG